MLVLGAGIGFCMQVLVIIVQNTVDYEEWTYVWRLYEPPELYHRRSDPSERLNLAGEEKHADVEERLRSVILRWLVETTDVLPPVSPRFPKVDIPRPGVR